MFRPEQDSSETSVNSLFNHLTMLVAREPAIVLRIDTSGYKEQRRDVTFRPSILRSSNLHIRTTFEWLKTNIRRFICLIQFFFRLKTAMQGTKPPTPQKSARNVCLSGRERRGGAERCVARHSSWETPATATSKQNTPMAAISVFTRRPIVKNTKMAS